MGYGLLLRAKIDIFFQTADILPPQNLIWG